MRKILLLAALTATLGYTYAQTNVGIGTNGPLTKLDINGALALREGAALTLINGGASGGANDNITMPVISGTSDIASFYRITGPTAVFSVYGIVPETGANGQIVTLINTSGKAMTIINNGSSTAVNGIVTQTGANLVDNASATANSSITLQYNKTAGKWYVTASQNFILGNGQLGNPSITVTAGTGLTGGGTVALGGSTTIGLTIPVIVADGGTGLTSITANNMIYGNGTSAANLLAPGATTGTLLMNTSAGAPSWTSLTSLPTTAGVLPVANGGTGSSTQGWVDLTTNQTAAGNKSWTGTGTFSNATYSALFTGGNVGIGTTVPVAPLHVAIAGTTTLSNGALDVFQPSLAAGNIMYLKLGVSNTFHNEADFAFNYAGSGSNSNYIGFGFNDLGSVEVITANGTVGVGTINPLSLLHANGTLTLGTPGGGTTPASGMLTFNNINSTQSVNISAGNTTTGYNITLPLVQGATGSILTNSDGAGTLTWVGGSGTGTAGYWTRSGTELYNTNTGDNVGIGISNPNAKLHVAGTLGGLTDWGILVVGDNNVSGSNGISIGYDNTNNWGWLYARTTGNTGRTIDINNNIYATWNGGVGIGNSAPGNNLLNVSNATAQAAANLQGAGISLTGQTGNGSGGGGPISITAGNGGTGGVGGSISITGGTNGTSTFGGGGNVTIAGGNANTSSGYGVGGGALNLSAGNCYNAGGSGGPGNVNITAGGNYVGANTLGNINFYTYYNNANATSTTQAMAITGSNNYVQVGTSTAASGKLQVWSGDNDYGELQVASTTATGEASMSFVSGATALGTVPVSTNGNAYVWDIGAGNYGIGGNKFGIGNAAYGGAMMTLEAAGNVGIGTTSPANLFSVGSSSQFQVSSAGAIAAAAGIISSGTITFSGLSTAGIVTNTSGGVLGTTPTVPVANGGTGSSTQNWVDLTTNQSAAGNKTWTGTGTFSNATYSALFTGGNVGLGTTTPQTPLEVAAATTDVMKVTSTLGGAGNHSYIDFVTFSTPTNNYVDARIGAIDMGSNDGSLVFETGNQGSGSNTTTERMRILNTGNVGIGTTTPGAKLQVAGGGNQDLVVGNSGTNPQQLLIGNNGTSGGVIQAVQQNIGYDILALNPNGGNVGIGNNNAGNTLEVTGGSNASGLRFTNLKSATATSSQTAITGESFPDFYNGKMLGINTTGDVVLQSHIFSESHYTSFVRWFPLLTTLGGGVYTLSAVFPGTDDYGLPYVTTSTVANGATNFPYGVSSGSEPSSWYINPAYNNIDDNAYMQHSSTYYALIYDFYFVFPATGSYTFSFAGIDDAATLYTTNANDLNPADMTSRLTAVYNTNSGNSSTNYVVSAAAGDVMRARLYWAQGSGGENLTLNVSGATTNLMSLIYNIK